MSADRCSEGNGEGSNKAPQPAANTDGPAGLGRAEVMEGGPPPGVGLNTRDRDGQGGGNNNYAGRSTGSRGVPRSFRGGKLRGGRSGRMDPRERTEYDSRPSHRGQGRGAGGRQYRLEGTVESITDVYASAGGDQDEGQPARPISYEGVIASFGFRGGSAENGVKFRFTEGDVMGKSRLSVGDKVEFYRFDAAPSAAGDGPKATRVRSLTDRRRRDHPQSGAGEGRLGAGNPSSSGHAGKGAGSRGIFHLGVVVTLKETYGFLLSLRSGSQYFFHFSEFIGSSRSNSRLPPPELEIGIVVRFVLAKNPSTGKDIGKSICLVSENGKPQFALREEDRRLVGTILKKPSDLNLPQDIGDGLVEFEVPGPPGQPEGEKQKQTAIVCKKQLNESHVHIEQNDVVYFDCHRGEKVDLCIAKSVVLKSKPYETFDLETRELGVISANKGSFGFITCTERMADVFLHFSQFPDLPKEGLAVGTDVEFSVIRGPETGRLQAVDLKLAEPGSAVFEELEEGVHEGTVVERLPNQNLRKGNPSLLLTGLIEGTVDGRSQKFPFMHTDRADPKVYPKQGDKVTFQIVTDLKRERAAKQAGKPGLGRRATKVTVVVIEGTVAAMKGSFGFIEYDRPQVTSPIAAADQPEATEPVEVDTEAPDEQGSGEAKSPDEQGSGEAETKEQEGDDAPAPAPAPAGAPPAGKRKKKSNRIFFHVSEILENLILNVGDTVEFIECINQRTKELNARRIKRIREAPPKVVSRPVFEKPPAKVEERPEHLKFGSELRLAMRLAKGPDGTKGFSKEYQESRGKVFPVVTEEEAGTAEDEGEDDGTASLNIAAAPFIPASLKP